ncbi:MAG: zinc ribbon domain-containing protein [Terriglobia bacterium]|jgi:RNA polymerase subunit RPABC4/transcription elongation factor Spt4
MAEKNQRVKEGVRLVRWRMAHENTRFVDEFRIIPGSLKIVAITLFIVGQIAAQIGYFADSRQDPLIAFVGGAAAVSLVLGFLLMLFGYINRDAKRRGMNSTLWTLLAIFVPYAIGVIIYFLMREPLPYNCPACGALVNARFNFCPGCKHDLRPSCPQCKREVRLEDKYCPYCAQELPETRSPQPEQKTGQTVVSPTQ